MKAQASSIVQETSSAPHRASLAQVFIDVFPAMNVDDQRLAATLYRFLAEESPVSLARLTEILQRDTDELSKALDSWPGVFFDDNRCIVGFWGLSVGETSHKLEVDGKAVYAWCAWDTLFLPALLDTTLQVASHCVQTGEPVQLSVSPHGIESVEPASVMVSFLEPDENAIRENVTTSFCHFVHFFRDQEVGSHWVANHPGTFLLTLEEAFDIGRQVNAALYRELLQVNFSPCSVKKP